LRLAKTWRNAASDSKRFIAGPTLDVSFRARARASQSQAWMSTSSTGAYRGSGVGSVIAAGAPQNCRGIALTPRVSDS
jgi:hypothetical protein